MPYYVRNKAGEAKAKISNDLANMMMRETTGHFREANYQGGKKTVFEFNRDFTYGTDTLKIMLWAGDTLVPIE